MLKKAESSKQENDKEGKKWFISCVRKVGKKNTDKMVSYLVFSLPFFLFPLYV